jgi:hypothetical protein
MPGLFLEKQPYDDVVLWPAAMIGAKSIEAFDIPLYNYMMDRPGQSISAEVRMKQIGAHIKSVQYMILFYEKHPVAQGSTKAAFINNRNRKNYNTYYRISLTLPYRFGKQVAGEWDAWVQKTDPVMSTVWIKSFRLLPYWMYRMMHKGIVALRKMHIKKADVAVYTKE